MAAYAAAQKSRASSVGSGEVIIRWVSRIPVRHRPDSSARPLPGATCRLTPAGRSTFAHHPLLASPTHQAGTDTLASPDRAEAARDGNGLEPLWPRMYRT